MSENKVVENLNNNNNDNNDNNNNNNNNDNNKKKQINLLNIDISNENVALNVLVGFINIAQKRGAFAINESAKIHECIQFFIKNV